MANPIIGTENPKKKKPYGGWKPYFKKPTDKGPPPILNYSYLEQSFASEVSPYKGWKYYFHDEGYTPLSPTVQKVKSAEKFFNLNPQLVPVDIVEKRFTTIDFKLIEKCQVLLSNWPSFCADLHVEPAHTLSCLGLALHQHVALRDTDIGSELPEVKVRLLNYEPITLLKNLKANLFQKLVSVRGTVIRVGSAKLICSWMAYACNQCGTVQSIHQADGVYKPPKVCLSDNCRSKTFSPLCSSNLTLTRNHQVIKLQENTADDQREGGRVPRTIECELNDDLIDMCGPGDNITVTGIVKVRNPEETKKNSKSANMLSLILETVSIVSSKGSSGRASNTFGVEFSIKDYYAIQEIQREEDIFRLLVNSLCPPVYGHEMVKAGLLLSLFGGSSSETRPDPHVLVVGDPGLGKSHMLHSCTLVAPRGVYVCGTTASSSGLTVTLTRESGGDFALEAGALVLANNGVCCIDEFDKMSSQHQALLEAMEQQRISIAKGGVVCSLPARATIIAAANPVGGHYTRCKTVSENLRMGSALLSRFDLVFILLDTPDQELDSMLSEHVMALHAGKKSRKTMKSQPLGVDSTLSQNVTINHSLRDRLKVRPEEEVDLVPHALLRKYIAYARKYVPCPKLSSEACHVLQEYYLNLRRSHQDTTPVTTRQLESMIRLTQARAKLELRESATESDAQDVVHLMEWSIRDTCLDETGRLDFSRSRNGSGISKTGQVKKFISRLETISRQENKIEFSVKELKSLAFELGFQSTDFDRHLTALNNQGYLIKKGPGIYQLVTV